jgi:hypothetical protein
MSSEAVVKDRSRAGAKDRLLMLEVAALGAVVALTLGAMFLIHSVV